jgi:chemotaxis protein methyltransferase CheR
MFEITSKEFTRFSDYIRANYGISLGPHKKILVSGRLGSLLEKGGFKSLSDYMDYVVSDTTGRAASDLVDRITTNHTFFMREASHFKYFSETVLPLFARTVANRDLRIWSAACSSGEEPYTLAMIMDRFFGKTKLLWDTRILATDISGNILDTAQKGVYSKQKVSALPEDWRRRYFSEFDQENMVLNEAIKKEVVYRKLNLMDRSFPFRQKFHAIFCRNVMIYFDSDTKNELAQKLYDLTEPGGFLFIGLSESLDRNSTRYSYIMPSVYRKV